MNSAASGALTPVVFFDRDGTLNRDLGHTHRPEDLDWLDGAIDAIREVNQRGWLAVVVTNQAGVAHGYYDEAAIGRFHAHMNAELAVTDARIDAFYYCPFHPQAKIERYRHPNHPDRKPNPGMLSRAFVDLSADPRRALIIGDQDCDLAAGRAAGIETAVATGANLRDVLIEASTRAPWGSP